MLKPKNLEDAKRAAGKAAASLIQNGMKIGLGTGTTAIYFMESLMERCRHEQLNIQGFPSSISTEKFAREIGIPLCDENLTTSLDIAVDGADEVDPQKRLIKGAGGALLREKIIATMSKEMIVIIDGSKQVEKLGGCLLPLEITPFAHQATLQKIRELGFDASLRRQKDNDLYITDNGNYIAEIKFADRCDSPEKDQAILSNIPGVVETGFFFGLAKKIIIGQPDGTVNIL